MGTLETVAIVAVAAAAGYLGLMTWCASPDTSVSCGPICGMLFGPCDVIPG